MHKGYLQLSALLGAFTVVMGAFAAHALKRLLSTEALNIFDTGVRYQFYHVVALMLTGILYKDFKYNTTIWAGRLFVAGIILFSGSLYLMTFMQLENNSDFRWIGAITPVGGAAFIIGWTMLFISFYKSRRQGIAGL